MRSAPVVTRLTEDTVKTCNPVFNQSFTMPVKEATTCQLEVTLWNAGERAGKLASDFGVVTLHPRVNCV